MKLFKDKIFFNQTKNAGLKVELIFKLFSKK
jgi:hypothetical protein